MPVVHGPFLDFENNPLHVFANNPLHVFANNPLHVRVNGGRAVPRCPCVLFLGGPIALVTLDVLPLIVVGRKLSA